MKLLLSNDDGYFAPGLACLATHVSQIAEVTVVAPDRNRSGASNSLTLNRPLRCYQTESGFYSVDGTPTDCVHLGSHRLMSRQPDIVVAGINAGANLGDDVLYSGTVAAAMEGRSLGFPALAVSLAGKQLFHYETAAKAVVKVIERLKNHPLETDRILNINVPDLPEEKIKGFMLTRLGRRHRADTIIPAQDPKGREIFWLGPPCEAQDIGEGTDFWAVEQGFISITPLSVDLTAYSSFEKVKDWMSKL